MIDVFYYSIAGKKTNDVIDDLILTLVESPFVPEQDKKLLRHSQDVAKNGNYPDASYYATFYQTPAYTYRSLAEITKYVKDTLDFYHFQSLQRETIAAINDSNSTQEYLQKLSLLVDTDVPSDDFDLNGYTIDSYDTTDKPTSKGIESGVKEIDELTYGFQPGTISTIAAFTGHGKTCYCTSVLYKNVMQGKKCVYVSLEMAPELMWQAFEARYMYQEKGLSIDTQDIRFHKLPADMKEKVEEARPAFKEAFNNLMIIDEGLLSQTMMLDYKSFSKLMRAVSSKLGGLDLVVFDHVGQFELLYPTHGNQILKQLQSFTKTFVDSRGVRPVSIWAVQTNRQGEQAARKRNYTYNLQAISDLNEVERSSTYVVFLYASPEMLLMNECRMTLAKNRLGVPLPEPAVVNMNPAVSIVGDTIEVAEMSTDEFASLTGGLGDFGTFDDEF